MQRIRNNTEGEMNQLRHFIKKDKYGRSYMSKAGEIEEYGTPPKRNPLDFMTQCDSCGSETKHVKIHINPGGGSHRVEERCNNPNCESRASVARKFYPYNPAKYENY